MNAITLSLYVGFALFTAFPYKTNIVATGGTLSVRVIIAIALYAVACTISYYILRKHLGTRGPRQTLQQLLQAILDAGFLLTLGFVSFGIQHVITLPPILSTVFGSSQYFFGWFIAPLLGVFFL